MTHTNTIAIPRLAALARNDKRLAEELMENDDTPVGRLLSRREAVAILGATGAALLTGSTHGVQRAEARLHGLSCVARPEQMEGPYFVDEKLNRTDIRSDPSNGEPKPGTALALTLLVSSVRATEC